MSSIRCEIPGGLEVSGAERRSVKKKFNCWLLIRLPGESS